MRLIAGILMLVAAAGSCSLFQPSDDELKGKGKSGAGGSSSGGSSSNGGSIAGGGGFPSGGSSGAGGTSACSPICATGETCCDAECVDTRIDIYNCGNCGTV